MEMAELFGSLNASLAFAAGAINAGFALLVLTRASRSAVSLTFLGICLASAAWNFGIALAGAWGRDPWFYLAIAGSPLLPALLLHFATALARPGSAGAGVAAAYALATPLAASSLLAIFHADVRRFVDGSGWNLYFIVVLLPLVGAAVARLVLALRAGPPPAQRSQIRILLLAILVLTLLGLTDLLQVFGIPVPKLGHLGSILSSSLQAVVIVRHRRRYDLLAGMRERLALLAETTAGVAHEVRTPLGSIRGAARLLGDELGEGATARARELLGMIGEEAARLDAILVDFQQLAGPVSLQREPLEVNDLVGRTVRLAEVGGLPAGIATHLAEGLPAVSADAAALKALLLNLIRNAAEAGGGIEIATAGSPGGVRVSVRDHGRGIPEEDLERVFEPFYSTRRAGMGLGLAISRRIAEAHGGRLEARNVPGGGAELAFVLPVR